MQSVSSTLLHIPVEDPNSFDRFYYVLLDAGEGTLGQIKRRFGPEYPDVLRALKLVFVSHLHADHHSGLSALFIERHKV